MPSALWVLNGAIPAASVQAKIVSGQGLANRCGLPGALEHFFFC